MALSITRLGLFLVIDVSAALHGETVIWESQREKTECFKQHQNIKLLRFFFFLIFMAWQIFSFTQQN